MNKVHLIVILSVILSVLSACSNVDQISKNRIQTEVVFSQLTEVEQRAVLAAEKFILENGYTDSTVTDTTKLVPESIEWTSNLNETILQRHGMLQNRALEVLDIKKGWMVLFEYSPTFLKDMFNGDRVRAVTMDRNYSDIRIEHKDLTLKSGRKILR